MTNKEWEPVMTAFSEGYGIKNIHSKSDDTAMKAINGKDAKYNEF
jgi:hypothetical protein